MLDLWPALPLVILGRDYKTGSMDNITAVLGHRDRVRQIDLWKLSGSRLKTVLAATQAPYPELVDLDLRLQDESPVSVPPSFLGGGPPHVYNPSDLIAFDFRVYRNCFCLPLTLSIFAFMKFLIPGTHPR